MKSNLPGKKKNLFLMYPRFLQMIFNEKYPQIKRTSDTLDMKALGPNTCGLMKQSRKATKVAFQGLNELVKFGKFVEVEDTPVVSSIYAELADEHMAPKPKFQFAFEYFIQQSISNPEEDAAVTPSVVTERECDTMVQSSIPTPKQIDTLIAELQLTARKPHQTLPVDTEPPSESDPDNSAHTLLPRKRKRRDPRPGVFITDPVQKNSTPIEPGFIAQPLQSPFTESSPVIQEISILLPDPTPMD
ncbi:unnamed protein product [Lactuca saligna]|uniref:Uncharacterized protein n=1 Tax=Lactuca saligna TaxID=75948 RepID=A0AA36EL85_LACSI|nr:unnamed protein product [Lactuca saligna]